MRLYAFWASFMLCLVAAAYAAPVDVVTKRGDMKQSEPTRKKTVTFAPTTQADTDPDYVKKLPKGKQSSLPKGILKPSPTLETWLVVTVHVSKAEYAQSVCSAVQATVRAAIQQWEKIKRIPVTISLRPPWPPFYDDDKSRYGSSRTIPFTAEGHGIVESLCAAQKPCTGNIFRAEGKPVRLTFESPQTGKSYGANWIARTIQGAKPKAAEVGV